MHDGKLIEVMFKLPYRFVTPDIIYFEELQDRHAYLTDLGLETLTMDGALIAIVEVFADRYRKPSRNDLFALVLAQAQRCALLTGDSALRSAAESENVKVHGTIWLVKEMFEKGLLTISDTEAAFSAMQSRGRRLPWDKIKKMIEEWKREDSFTSVIKMYS